MITIKMTKYIQHIYQHLTTIYDVNKEQILSFIGIAIFLIVTSLTYGIVTPVNQTTNNSLVTLTSQITNTTNTTNTTLVNSPLTNF
jgi:hypothetical protein